MDNPILRDFYTGGYNHQDDYYYTYTSNGRKIFHEKKTNKVRAKKYIPLDIIDKIGPKDAILDTISLVKLKDGYLKEIERLKSKIEEINLKLSSGNIPSKEELQEAEEKSRREEEDSKIRDTKNKKEKRENLHRFFTTYEKQKPNNQNKILSDSKLSESILFLKSYGIENVKQWKNWFIKNHPDKNPDIDSILCAKIISSGRDLGW